MTGGRKMWKILEYDPLGSDRKITHSATTLGGQRLCVVS